MENRLLSSTRSSENSAAIWIILAGLLLASALIGVGAMAVINANQPSLVQAGPQAVPGGR